MAERRYSRAEVEAVVAKPARGQFAPPARDIIEHFGYTANGRYPINVKVDLEANAAYVRYQPISGGQRFARNERLSQDVIIDFDADSHVLGIELLAFDEEAIGVARRFA